jgi:CIC family chloride channel protein
MKASIARPLRRLRSRLGIDRDWYQALMAAVIGAVMSAVAIGFILPLRWLEVHGEELAKTHPIWLYLLVPIVPAVGAFLAGIVLRIWGADRHDRQSPGVSAVIFAIHRQKSHLPIGVAIRKWIASTLTIGSGGSAGAEGPIVTIGSSIGSSIARLFKSTPQNTATLLGCGAAAGMASVFNAPIAGIFFVLEILLRDFSLRVFTPIVIASVISAACTRAILGPQDALFAVASDFSIDAFSMNEIPNYLVLGVICGVIAYAFIQSLDIAENRFSRLQMHWSLKPALGGAMLGVLGLITLMATGPGVPMFYGNGYGVIREIIRLDFYTVEGVLTPTTGIMTALAALAFMKLLATCLTIGSGGSGGLFAPSLLLGATVGGAFGCLVNKFGWFPGATPAHYAVVGMAAMIASTAHAPLTAILIVYEITQSYEIILPLMFTAVISTVVGRLLSPQSVYTLKLSRLGLKLGQMSDLTILRRLDVQHVTLLAPVTVRRDESAQRLMELSERHAISDFVVVDERNRYAGMVTGADLRATLVFREAVPLLQVNDLLRTDLPTVGPDESLDTVLDKFSTHDVQSLAVVAPGARDGNVLGLITRSRLMERYQAALNTD